MQSGTIPTYEEVRYKQLRHTCNQICKDLKKKCGEKVEYYRIRGDGLVYFYNKWGLAARLEGEKLEFIGSNTYIIIRDLNKRETEPYVEPDVAQPGVAQPGSSKPTGYKISAPLLFITLMLSVVVLVLAFYYPGLVGDLDPVEDPAEVILMDPGDGPDASTFDPPDPDETTRGTVSLVRHSMIEVGGVQITPALVDFPAGSAGFFIGQYCPVGNEIEYDVDDGVVPPGPIPAKIWCYGLHPSANGAMSVNEQLLARGGITVQDSHCAGSEFGGERWALEAGCR